MTDATPTILERLDLAIKFANYRSQVVSAEMMQDAKSEITRLQSELNTALERVKELEEAHRKIASTPYCGFAITSGLSRSDLEELVGTFWKEFETRVSISSAVLQSSGGK